MSMEVAKEWIKASNDDLRTISKIIDDRYPGDMGLLPYGNPTINDAEEFYLFAEKIFEKVCNLLAINI